MSPATGADVHRNVPLIQAVVYGYAAIFDNLLSAGANPTKPGSLKAVELGHHATVINLVLGGVDVKTGNICPSPVLPAMRQKNRMMVQGRCFF